MCVMYIFIYACLCVICLCITKMLQFELENAQMQTNNLQLLFMKQEAENYSKSAQIRLGTKIQHEEPLIDQGLDFSPSEEQKEKQVTHANLLRKYEETFSFKFLNTLDNPVELVYQLVDKLFKVHKEMIKIVDKYTQFQIQLSSFYNKIINTASADLKEDLQQCLTHHNVWSSKNGLVLMMQDSKKGSILQHNKIVCTKKRHQKFSNNYAIINKIPQNSILQIKLSFKLSQPVKLLKDDMIRLKFYPCNKQVSFSQQHIRCLTLDNNSMQKQKISNGDCLTFNIDMFNKKANAYYNETLIKFNEHLKVKKNDKKSYNFVPALQLQFGTKNELRSLGIAVSLNYFYKEKELEI